MRATSSFTSSARKCGNSTISRRCGAPTGRSPRSRPLFRVTLIAVGRLKPGPERVLLERYLDRARLAGRGLGVEVATREIDESRQGRAEDRKRDEANALRGSGGAWPTVALDETGRAMTSAAFATLLETTRDAGRGGLDVVIGGPDGLDPVYRHDADVVVSFGAMTWPHQLVRVMAGEQIYRALTILAGHPYHRV